MNVKYRHVENMQSFLFHLLHTDLVTCGSLLVKHGDIFKINQLMLYKIHQKKTHNFDMWCWSLKFFVLEIVKQWEERKNCILMLRLILKTEPRMYDDNTMWPLYRSSYLYINIQIQVPGSSMHQVWTRSLGDTWPGPVLLRERHIAWTLTIMIRATWGQSRDLTKPQRN